MTKSRLRSIALPSLMLSLCSSLSLAQTIRTDSEQNLSPLAPQRTMIVQQDIQHDVSLPLREMIKMAPEAGREAAEAEELRTIPLQTGYKPAEEPDSVLQRNATALSAQFAPTLISNFDGIGQGVPPSFVVCCTPPDTNGAVGLTHYVQWVNTSFAVFDKTSGNMLAGYPVLGNTLWQGFGGPCETNNDGDPVVLYDRLNDRWIFGQFAVRGSNNTILNPTLQCIAVSTTSDATGSYFRYAFLYNNEVDDYPKMAVWPDAYYVTFNMFSSNLSSFLGTDACAYDGNAMRNGLTATQICFQQTPSVGGVLPADVDGSTPPPAGSPNYMIEFDVNSLNLYKFHVDFINPPNSSFGPAINIPVAPFTPFLCNFGFSFSCVPQPNTTTLLDTLGDRLMFRLAYRNFGDHESLVLNHSVLLNSGNSGVRWYELQNPNGAVTVAQQSTFAPDSNFRWMGSVAMDQFGDLALGYSVSSSTVRPTIAVAGRSPLDPPNTLGNETIVITGGGSQTVNRNGVAITRWGDYSAMQIDPSDDCTFWYTTEYMKIDGVLWNTRIANFKFPLCGLPDLTIASAESGSFTQAKSGTYTLTVTNIGPKDTDPNIAVNVTDTLPAGLTANTASGTGWTCSLGPPVSCTRSDVLAAHSSYPAITLTVNVDPKAPGIVTNTATVSGGGDQNTNNNTATNQTTIIQTGPDPAISKTHSGTFVESLTGTYTINVKNAGLTPTDGTPVTVSDTMPTGLTVKTVSGTGWDCSASTTSAVSCTRSDVLASVTSYPAITLTVNVASDAPASVINTATVSGGGDVNSFNDSSSDKTNVTLRPDLTITKSHSGDFHQGQNNATYILTVNNIGGAATSGTVTVTDTVPAGLNLSSAFGGGWFCNNISAATVSCTRSDALAPNSSYSQISLFVTVPNDAPASVTNIATVSGGGEANTANDSASDPTTVQPSPDLTIAKSHTPDPFVVGQTGTYTITVGNSGHVGTSSSVTVTDPIPAGLTATAISATGWSCGATPTTFVSCSRSDALAVGSSYPAITVTVSVDAGDGPVTNFAFVNGGGEFNTSNDTASDVTTVAAPILSVTKSHTGNFTVGQTGTYTITVSNVGSRPTIGSAVNVNDPLPLGMTAATVAGNGWSCSGVNTAFVNCNRSDVLAAGSNYPPIMLTVSVGGSVAGSVPNFVFVNGGGDLNQHSTFDQTNINLPDLQISLSHAGNFSPGQVGATYTINISNVGTLSTAGGTLIVQDNIPTTLIGTAVSGTGWSCNLFGSLMDCRRDAGVLQPGSSYPPITLTVNVAPNPGSSVTDSVFMSNIGLANSNHTSASDVATVTGFGITPVFASQTVTAGSSVGFLFTAGLASNAGTVTFSATGLPPNSKATFNPTSTAVSVTLTMTMDTSGNGHTAMLVPPPGGKRLDIYLGYFVAALTLCGIGACRRGKRRVLWLATSICILAFMLVFIGCGGGGGGTPPPPPAPPVVTPSGTYTITVTGTSSTAGVPAVNVPVTLVVK